MEYSFVSVSSQLMNELRKLRTVLHALGIHVKAEWLPSVVNRYTDALSRRFDKDDVTIRQRLLRSVANGMRAPDSAFANRPLGEHPIFRRRQCLQELDSP